MRLIIEIRPLQFQALEIKILSRIYNLCTTTAVIFLCFWLDQPLLYDRYLIATSLTG